MELKNCIDDLARFGAYLETDLFGRYIMTIDPKGYVTIDNIHEYIKVKYPLLNEILYDEIGGE